MVYEPGTTEYQEERAYGDVLEYKPIEVYLVEKLVEVWEEV